MFFTRRISWRAQVSQLLSRLHTDNTVVMTLCAELKQELSIMSKELDDLKAAVENNGTVVGSAVTAFQGIAQQMLDAKDNPDEIESLANELQAQSAALAAAVPTNTEAADVSGAPPNAGSPT